MIDKLVLVPHRHLVMTLPHVLLDLVKRNKKEILNITQMGALLGRARFNELLGEYVIKPQGKPTLVRSEDKRPEWNSAEKAAEDFKDIK